MTVAVPEGAVPQRVTIVLDCPDPGALAGFYAELLDRSDDLDVEEDNSWATIGGSGAKICFQQAVDYRPPTWPASDVPQMLHLDLAVTDLFAAHERALRIGARLLDRTNRSFWVYADPAGHPFCLCAC
ncbi:VOC family protein [Actinokineospora enzanensis]|uniref:VOC family protein n=1 Tax=Actinokineospora enzanensis TaxID=155975 RepID=UPI00037739E9|nr:VOC family protein [Actinokineospora enzanensis]